MKASRLSRTMLRGLLAGGSFCFAFCLTASGQVETTTKTTQDGAATKTVKVERGTVVYVSGNSCVIKAEDGTLRHFNNVPDSTTVTVDGKQLNIHQLQPGMTVERQTITTTTPQVITTIKTVSGTVWFINPPNSVILTMENGKNQEFKIPNGQKFMVNGQETDAFGLRKGMKVDAQQVIEQPATVVAQIVKRTGSMPPPPPAPKPDVNSGSCPSSGASACSSRNSSCRSRASSHEASQDGERTPANRLAWNTLLRTLSGSHGNSWHHVTDCDPASLIGKRSSLPGVLESRT